MSKRIVCALLALIMLVGLIPAGVISASAASNLAVSENAIKVIKDFEGFTAKAYLDGSQYTYGYGTKAPDKDATITEANADKALREELKEINIKVNNFAAANGLNLSQSKHDALVSFTFNVGWAWMSQPNYRITKAVLSGATGNDFLQAITLWSNVDSIPSAGLVNRRMAEANMYLNGVYNVNPPVGYTYVRFDANGGTLGEDKVQAYNVNNPVTITSIPVRTGYTFLGWYNSTQDDAVWVGVLNADTSKKVLYARWQDNNASVEGGKVVGTPAAYVISGLNFASNKVYSVPNSNNAAVKTIEQNDVFKVTAEYIDNNGDKWLKIESGWVKLGQIKVSTTTGSGHTTVTVTNDYVNIRKDPNTDAGNAPVGYYLKGEKLLIIATKEVNGILWGQSEKGWIALMYTDFGSVATGGSGTNGMGGTAAGSNVVIATGTVLVNNTNLNVRTGAGLTYGIVGTLTRDTKIDLYEITTVNGHGWGRISTDGKWVCLDYVNYKKVDTVTTTENNNGPVTIDEPYKFKATVNADGLNIYQDPTTGLANPVASLKKNDNVSIFEIVAVGDKTFGKIISKNIVGWIQLESQYVAFTASGTVSVVGGGNLDVFGSVAGAPNGKTIKNGTAVTILELGAAGDKVWGRVSEGWINLDNVKLNTTKAPIVTGSQMSSTTTTTTGKVIYTGIVSSGINLNVRLGAGVNYDIVHSLTNGTEVKVYDKQIVNGHYWGKMGENAWICLTYVTETTNNAGANGAITDGNTNTSTSTGTNSSAMNEMATVVNCTTGVNIRSTPSVSGALIGSAPLNSRVRVLETTVYNGTKWARTEDGWISMLYLKLDSDSSYAGNSTVSVNGLFEATVLVNQINVTDAIGGGTAVATMKKGESAYVSEIQSANGSTISGKVTVGGKTGWIDLGNTTYTARGQVNVSSGSELIVRDSIAGAEKSRLANGSSVTIVEIRANTVGATTTLWGKISMTEWVDLQYVKLIATTASAPSNSNVTKTGLGKIAYADTVNVRKAAGTNNDIVTKLNKGTEVTLYEETIVDEAIWIRISTSSINGWVAKEYIEVVFAPTTTNNTGSNNNTNSNAGTSAPQVSNYATGIVNSNIPLKVRQQPDINSAIVTELPYGMTITIYEQRKGGSMDWGRVDNGWVSLSYVTMTSTGSTGAGNMATIIKAFSAVNVRAEATTTSAKVGEVMVGSRVEVLEQKYVNGYTWYRINNGWVHGDYIQLDAPFVSNAPTNNNTETNTPATGPQDEVGGMSTTAILKHRVNDVVEFFDETATGLQGNGTKLVNGETVVITGLKGFGTDVWANTKHGWFNLTDESINFVAVGKVNTRDNNYLMVRAEAGKTSTEPVDKIRDQASITLTGVSISGGKLWGKTAKGWVELDDVEMTCIKHGVAGGVITEVANYGDLQVVPANYLTVAKAKTQHISINVYNAVNGYSVGIFKNTANIYIKDVQVSGSEIWGSVLANVGGKEVTVWIKLSDVTYANIDTYITSNCYATASAGGVATIGTEFKATNPVSINNLTVVGGTIYGQVVSATNYSGWLPATNLTRWAAIPAEETAANFAGYIFYGTPKQIINVYDKVDGTAVGTLRSTSTSVLIKEITASGSEVWGKTATNKGNRWVKLSDLNYSVGSSYISVDCNAFTYAGGTTVVGPFVKGNGINVGTLAVGGGKIYGQVTSSTNNGGWVAIENLSQWYVAPGKVTTLANAGAYIFKSTIKVESGLKDAPAGTTKGTAKVGEAVRVSNMTVAGGEIWAEVHTSTLDEATNVRTAGTCWIKLSSINGYTANATAKYACYSRESTVESSAAVKEIAASSYLKIVAFEMGAYNELWAKIEYIDTDLTTKTAYIHTNHLTFITGII